MRTAIKPEYTRSDHCIGMTVDEFVVREAGRVPEPSSRLTVCGLEVEVESADDKHITSAIVTPPDMDATA